MQKNIIIGTAGHIDHGKSTLIKALTGDDTDRLQQEKERGISIELGFSHMTTQESKEKNLNLGIVDVPGHEKFVNKMLAAAGGMDIALIVIAADEGVMPQTKEHLAILDLLGLKKAVIVLNKIDLVEAEWLELVIEDIKENFAGTFAENAKIIQVSAVKNINIKRLESEIIKLAEQITKKNQGKLPYFPIDRVFSLSGQGTIVTGTLLRGELEQGSEMMLYPQEKKLKIRSLENHEKQQKLVSSGSRVGINISGLDKKEIKTGDIIAQKKSLYKSKFFEAEIKLLDDLNFTVKNGDKVHLHTAAAEKIAVIYIYDKKEIFPGEKAYIKLKLEEELALFYKEKYILRRFSPMQTIGGGVILEIDPPPRRKTRDIKVIDDLKRLKNADLKNAVEEFIYQNKEAITKLTFLKQKTAVNTKELKEIIKILKAEKKILELGQQRTYIHQKDFINLKEDVLNTINQYHSKYQLQKGIKKEELRSQLDYQLDQKEMAGLLDILKEKRLIKEDMNFIALKDFQINLSSEENKIKNKILNEFNNNLFSPPTRIEIINKYQREDLVAYLEREKKLFRLNEELDFHPDVFQKSKELLKSYFKNSKTIEISDFRDLINSSRRYAVPLLEKLDELKITKRKGDLRLPGDQLFI